MIVRNMGKRAQRARATAQLTGGLALASVLPWVARAQVLSATPDAQVEANVLKALAAAPELSAQDVQSSTVYGVVTLSGTVQTEEMRTRAENLAARATGVKKVVDELTLGNARTLSASVGEEEQASAIPDASQQPVLQTDGTYAPAQPQQPASPYTGPPARGQGSETYNDGAPSRSQADGNPSQAYGQAPPYPRQANEGQQTYGQQPVYGQSGNEQYPYGQPNGNQPTYGSADPRYGQPGYGQPNGNQPGYGQAAPGYRGPAYGPYGQAPSGYPPQTYRQGPPQGPPITYGQGYGTQSPSPSQGGQQPGMQVVVPSGALLRVRMNRGLDSNHIQPGTPFDGTVLNDISGSGAIAIPRGATVQGVVVDARRAGALKGEGQLALQINAVWLGGSSFPLVSDLWERQGSDKSVRTVNSALGLGVLGAIVGGVAGGGAGAAVGAGVGAGVGVAGSAASSGGQIIVPPEAVLTFHLAQPAEVRTVSEQEMQRLAYAVGPGSGTQPVMRRRYYPAYPPYYAPAPYPYRY